MYIKKLSAEATQRIRDAQEISHSLWERVISSKMLFAAIINSGWIFINKIIKDQWTSCEEISIQFNNLLTVDESLNSLAPANWVWITNELSEVLEYSEKIMEEVWDTQIFEDHLFLSLIEKNNQIKEFAKKFWINSKKVKDYISKNRTDRFNQSFEDAAVKLSEYTVDLVELAKQGKIDPVIWRENEIRRTVQILSRRTKNNPVLIWFPGTWKTAIVEWLAKKIADWDVPDVLKNKRILSLDIWALMSWTEYRWQFETKMKELLNGIEKSEGNAILFIDELHTIVWTWNKEGWADISNLLKPALARWTIKIIWATTISEYRKHIEKDAALERRFQPVNVDEPTREDTITILKWLRWNYESFHWVKLTDDAIVAAVDMSIRYLPDRKLPDKAIDVIDEALSNVKMSSTTKPQDIDDMEREIRNLEINKEWVNNETLKKEMEWKISSKTVELKNKIEKWNKEKTIFTEISNIKNQILDLDRQAEEFEWVSDFQAVAKIKYSELPKLTEKLAKAEKTLEKLNEIWSYVKTTVWYTEIADIVSKWAGLPVGKLIESDKNKFAHLDKILKETIFWQDEALEKVSDTVMINKAGLSDENKPIGSFIFLWPTWVGKTETAKTLASQLFDSEEALIRLDMSEYMEKHSISRLIWSPPGYIWYDEGWQLTEAVRRKPYSIILFDEIEKAHPDVANILLQILDDWALTDWKGRRVNFKNTIIIMTSNIWSDESFQWLDKKAVIDKLKLFFRPELINRVDEIVLFKPLWEWEILKIAEAQLNIVKDQLMKKWITLEFDESLTTHLVKEWFDPIFWARPMKRAIKWEVLKKLSEYVLTWKLVEWKTYTISYDGEIKVK